MGRGGGPLSHKTGDILRSATIIYYVQLLHNKPVIICKNNKHLLTFYNVILSNICHIWVISSINTRGQQCATEIKCIGKPICLTKLIHKLIWYRVLLQGERQFLFAIRVGCVVVWQIFSTSKMTAFCIYFYQRNITFKKIINLVSFIINLAEYLVINTYSVTVLDNFRKETSDRAKKHLFLEVFNSLTFILGNPSTFMVRHLGWRFDEDDHFDSLNYHFFFFTTSLQVGEFHSCMALSIISIKT